MFIRPGFPLLPLIRKRALRNGLFAVLFAVFSGCMDQQAPIVKIAATESAPTPFAGATSAISISSGTQIKISWNASTDSALTGYRLYSVGEDGTLTILASPIPKSVTSYTHGGRTPGEAYRYLVRSLSGTKELDENMSIVTAVAYVGVTGSSSVSYHTASLTFPSVSNEAANALKVYCSYRGGPDELIASLPVSSTFYTLTGLRSGTTYTCKVVPENLIGVDEESSTTESFQTTSYTAAEFKNVVVVQAFGPAPNAPNAESVYAISQNDPPDLYEHNTTSAQPFVRVSWDPFTNAVTNTQYFLFRVIRNEAPDFTAGSNTTCTSSTTTTCLVCVISPGPASAGSCVDTNVAPSPAQYDYYITRAASTTSSTLGIVSGHTEEIPTATLSSYTVAVPIPPENMALVHRESANYEICKLMGKTPDPLNKNRCPYNGLGAKPTTINPLEFISLSSGYYDLGYNVFIDRWEMGCSWTPATAGGMCGAGGTPGNCFGVGTPNTTFGVEGNVYYMHHPSNRRCYVRLAGSWSELGGAATMAYHTIAASNEGSTPTYKRGPMGYVSAGGFSTICGQTSVSGYPGRTKRLMRRREFVAASAWPTQLYEPGRLTQGQANQRENANIAGRHSTLGYCNYQGNIDHANTSFNAGEHVGDATNQTYNIFVTGSNSTRNCVSRYGIQDLIGQLAEFQSDTLIPLDPANLPGGTYIGTIGGLDSGNDDMNGIVFDHLTEAPGHSAISIGTGFPGAGINYFSVPLGLGLFHDDGGNALLIGTDLPLGVFSTSHYRFISNADQTQTRRFAAGGAANTTYPVGRWSLLTDWDQSNGIDARHFSVGGRCAFGVE